jgi:hypothetical protein
MRKLHLLSFKGLYALPLLALPVLFTPDGTRAQAASASGAGMCRHEAAVGVPSWVTTGTWRNDKLLVVDVAGRKLVQISDRGVATEMRSALAGYLQAFGPTRIREAQSQNGDRAFMVEVAGGKVVDVDRNLTPQRKMELATTTMGMQSEAGQDSIAMLLDWTQAGKDVIGYADIQGPGQGRASWKNGFVRFKADQPKSFSIVRERLFPDNARASMVLTYPLMASIGETGYVALIDGQEGNLGLWRFVPGDKELHRLSAFPKRFERTLAPLLPDWGARKEDFSEVMAAVERETMPAGLWAWDSSLYLLFRAFESGERHWYLSRIDPEQDNAGRDLSRTRWTVRIPSTANHMTVVPGPKEWAFLEKGPVTGWLSQETKSIFYVNSTLLRQGTLSQQNFCR